MKTLKYSRQRESIKGFLAERNDHPTADTIYEELRKDFPNISLGTVYRNLALLEKIGAVHKISPGTGADRYDCNTALHNHFICKKCDRIINLDMGDIDYIMDVATENLDGTIENYVTHFHGVCGDCERAEMET